MRCGLFSQSYRELQDQNALYGWRCAEILGVSETLDNSSDATWNDFFKAYSDANDFLSQHRIAVDKIDKNAFYEAYIKKQIAASLNMENAAREIEKEIFNILTDRHDAYFDENRKNGNEVIKLKDLIKIREYYEETIKYFEDVTYIKTQIDEIKKLSKKVMPYSIAPWDSGDVFAWQTIYLATGRHDYIIDYKNDFIVAYRDVIKSAADTYGIPAEMLAGVALCEVAGDPMWIDDAAYNWRVLWYDLFDNKLIKTNDPKKTSYGYLSMQVRVAAETLGYNPDELDLYKSGIIIDALKDINFNIYLSAKHLADLKKIDYARKKSSELTDDEIAAIAGRYNIGKSASLEEARDSDYAKRVFENIDNLRMLLHPYTYNILR